MCVNPGQGLHYRDDDSLLVDSFNEDYDDKHFGEAASDRNCNRIMGGPQPPPNVASNAEIQQYKAQQKALLQAPENIVCRGHELFAPEETGNNGI